MTLRRIPRRRRNQLGFTMSEVLVSLIVFTIAVVGLEGYRKTALLTFVVPLMALAVPLLDALLSVVRRFRERQRIMGADRMHMHHHLLHVSGGSQRDVVLSLYFLTACFCILAVALRSVSGAFSAIPSATLRASASSAAFGNTRFAIPICRASSAIRIRCRSHSSLSVVIGND